MQKNKPNISPRTIKVIGVSICAIFSLILLTLVIFNYQRYAQAKKRFAEENSRLLALEEDARELKKFIRYYQEERERFGGLLFSDKDIAAFIDKIADFARRAQVKITEMKAQRFQNIRPPDEISGALAVKRTASGEKKEGPDLHLAALPINMTIEGKFARISEFLFSLEQYRQLLTLSNVSIKRVKYPILTCKFTLRLYSLRRLEEITGK